MRLHLRAVHLQTPPRPREQQDQGAGRGIGGGQGGARGPGSHGEKNPGSCPDFGGFFFIGGRVMNEMALDCCNNEIYVEIVLLQKSLFV